MAVRANTTNQSVESITVAKEGVVEEGFSKITAKLKTLSGHMNISVRLKKKLTVLFSIRRTATYSYQLVRLRWECSPSTGSPTLAQAGI